MTAQDAREKDLPHPAALRQLRAVASPVAFHVDCDEYPVSVAGTAFLVGHGGSIYVITPAHVVRNYDPLRLIIFPSLTTDAASERIRLVNFWRVKVDPEDPETTDIVVIEADVSSVSKSVSSGGRVIDLTDPRNHEWRDQRWESVMFLMGYPTEINEMDYANLTFSAQQTMLAGAFAGPTRSRCCHKIRVTVRPPVTDFNGLSGSPVFSLESSVGQPHSAKFAGMVLLGTASSGLVRFVEAERILQVLSEMRTPAALLPTY